MILVTGGCRSGKSEFAEELVKSMGQHYLYLATAKITDDEMARRVERHQARRSDCWDTHEGYYALEKVLEETQGQYDGILLDCVTTMVTNLLFDFIGDKDWDTFDFADVDYKAAEQFIIPIFEKIAQAAAAYGSPLVVVTDEIGLGVVPDTYLGRAFRDLQGFANQVLAKASDDVYLVVSGIPVHIKGGRA